MPVIKVFSTDDPTQAFKRRPHLAAAVMAVTLAKASSPSKAHEQPKKARAERTRPGNPNRLTVNQHVFPAKSIERFTDQSGRVSVHQLHRTVVIRAKPDNAVFCARRAWDQRAESGYMKRIEDDFQKIVGPIADGTAKTLASELRGAVDRMYALWYMRSRHRDLESQEIKLNEISGDDLTKEQEENLEKNGYVFARGSGRMPARQINGIELQFRIESYARDLATRVTRWGVIAADCGEFIVPDVPLHGIIPLTPRLALVQSAPDGMIVERNVAEINKAIKAASQDYFFARDFSSCPFF
jgi:hypothetical protein